MIGSIFFALMAALCLGGAIVTIGSKNPIRSAVGLLVTIGGIAALFLRLNAQFLAAIQLIVYAGAVVVLFVFVIMLLGPDASAAPVGMPKAGRLARTLAGLSMLGLAAAGGIMFFLARPRGVRLRPVPPEFGSVELVGKELFTQGIVPFELVTALLIVAVVGAIGVARSSHKPKRRRAVEHPHKLFHGPLMARDAQRPLTKERV